MLVYPSEPLKPCPFCGGPAGIHQSPVYDYDGNFIYRISCSKCGATTLKTEQDDIYQTPQKAINKCIKAWNSRPN